VPQMESIHHPLFGRIWWMRFVGRGGADDGLRQ
jgi:hypothetical protein